MPSRLFFFASARQVDYVDLEGKTFLAVPGHTLKPKYEFGTMTHFAYRVEGGAEGEELVVATTRLETMLGDTVRKNIHHVGVPKPRELSKL